MSRCQICDKEISWLNTATIELPTKSSTGVQKLKLCKSCGENFTSYSQVTALTFTELIEPVGENMVKMLNDTNGDLKIITQEFINAYKEQYDKTLDEARIKEGIITPEKQKEQEQKEKQKIELMKLIASHKLTTGYSFDNYKITTYHGIISGDSVIGTGLLSEMSAAISDLFGSNSNAFANKMIEAKNAAKRRLVEQSVLAGGNAIIGIDFDYITFAGNMLGVSANGTSVTIEKMEE